MILAIAIFAFFGSLCQSHASIKGGMLFPRESTTRQIQELDGIWNFRIDDSPSRDEGLKSAWFSRPLSETGTIIPMPVPSSYNDITTDPKIRDFVGWVWYDRTFYVDPNWSNKNIFLRFDSAHYYTKVYLNGMLLMEHNGGHLPFQSTLKNLKFDGPNLLTVAVNNTLSKFTLPPGSVINKMHDPKYPPGYYIQKGQFDFFNYAGIHRRVRLFTTPKTYVDDITIVTDFSGNTGIVNYTLSIIGSPTYNVRVDVVDRNGTSVGNSNKASGTILIKNVNLWWPYTMNKNYGYMYNLVVTVTAKNVVDSYSQPFGVRTVRATDSQFLINNRPFYCHGVAKHEDSDIRGKGLDFPLIARDFVMLKWLGANCVRTSHYPYAEEFLDQANTEGVAIIDESPGVGIQAQNMNPTSLSHHLNVETEQIRRDKNRPAVIMWSVANEPQSQAPQAEHYFKTVIEQVRKLDPTRPVTFVSAANFYNDKAAQFVDVVCFNRYYSWYDDPGHPEVIPFQLKPEIEGWRKAFGKPIIMTEYGADTIVGLHTMPVFMFTEDYQVDLLKGYHPVFDELRKEYFVGEMVWNFADFMTDQSTTRVVGNKKGLLTRQRQPKESAHLMRRRYWNIINETSFL